MVAGINHDGVHFTASIERIDGGETMLLLSIDVLDQMNSPPDHDSALWGADLARVLEHTTGPSALRLRPPVVPPASGGCAATGMPLASTAIMGCCCGLVSAVAMPWIDSGSGHVPGYSPARKGEEHQRMILFDYRSSLV